MLRCIAYGLETIEETSNKKTRKKHEKLDVDRFSDIIEDQLKEDGNG